MNPALLLALEFLVPLAAKLVERWLEEDVPDALKRAHVVSELAETAMPDGTKCGESKARCALEVAVHEGKAKQ